MIRLPLSEIQPGMVLAKSIIGEQGDLLLAAGFVINDRVLHKMRSMELTGCWIYEEGTEHIVPEEMISEQLALQTQGALRDNAALLKQVVDTRTVSLKNVREAMGDGTRFHNILAAEAFKSAVKDILDSLLNREPVAINLSSLRNKSGYHYQHSLDVTLTAVLLGQNLKIPFREMEELALGSLLMDVGMVILSDSILDKPGSLEGEELALYQEHPSFGYAILRENERIPLTTAHVAYQHHERQDGNGYPRRLRGINGPPVKNLAGEKGRIHRYAEIAAVADAYVSLIAPRPGTRPPLTPEEAVKALIQAAGGHLNRTVVDALVTLIPIYPVGAKVVVVRDSRGMGIAGYSGVVVKTRMDRPAQPEILLLQDKYRRKIPPKPLNLAEEPGIKIQFCRLE